MSHSQASNSGHSSQSNNVPRRRLTSLNTKTPTSSVSARRATYPKSAVEPKIPEDSVPFLFPVASTPGWGLRSPSTRTSRPLLMPLQPNAHPLNLPTRTQPLREPPSTIPVSPVDSILSSPQGSNHKLKQSVNESRILSASTRTFLAPSPPTRSTSTSFDVHTSELDGVSSFSNSPTSASISEVETVMTDVSRTTSRQRTAPNCQEREHRQKRKAKKKARHLTKKQEEVQKQEIRKQGVGEELTLSERENIRSDPMISDIEMVASEPEDTPWRPKDASDPSSTSVVLLGLAKSNIGGGGGQQNINHIASPEDANEFRLLSEPLSRVTSIGSATTTASRQSISKTKAKRQAKEAAEVFFDTRDLNEAELNFIRLPPAHRHLFVHNLVNKAMKSTEENAQLVGNLFDRVLGKDLCSQDAFDEGFIPTFRNLDPQTCTPSSARSISVMLKAARLDGVCEKLLRSLQDLLETTPKASPRLAPVALPPHGKGMGVDADTVTSVPSDHVTGPSSSGVTVGYDSSRVSPVTAQRSPTSYSTCLSTPTTEVLYSVAPEAFKRTVLERVEDIIKSKDLDKAEELFLETPLKYTRLLVEVLFFKAIESKSEAEIEFIEQTFDHLGKQELTQHIVVTSLRRVIGITTRIARATTLKFE